MIEIEKNKNGKCFVISVFILPDNYELIKRPFAYWHTRMICATITSSKLRVLRDWSNWCVSWDDGHFLNFMYQLSLNDNKTNSKSCDNKSINQTSITWAHSHNYLYGSCSGKKRKKSSSLSMKKDYFFIKGKKKLKTKNNLHTPNDLKWWHFRLGKMFDDVKLNIFAISI